MGKQKEVDYINNYWSRLLCAIFNAAAITIYNKIFFSSHYYRNNKRILKHELKHVEQFYNIKFFPIKYLWVLLTQGKNNKYEKEAILAEKENDAII
ncbi:MAG: DUF4157 domain-containing protein [Candidatus Humimicrobiia bacterium]